MKKLKEEKGITLVALIITIVVLLILAVVAIGAVHDSKIIAHAQNAAGSFNQAKDNEVSELQVAENLLDSIVKGDIKERLRVALEKLFFSGNMEDITTILNEYNMTYEEMEKTAIMLPIQNSEGSSKDARCLMFSLDSNMYEYYIDDENGKVTLLDVSHPNYAEIQQFKDVSKIFLGKNIEEFEQEKIDERYWKIKGVNILDKNEIIVKYNDSFTSGDGTYFEGYIKMDYIEGWGITLTLENDSISSDNKLQGKIIGVGIDDGNI